MALLMKDDIGRETGQMNQYNGSWDFTGPKPVGEF
jgi:hypothetical protein